MRRTPRGKAITEFLLVAEFDGPLGLYTGEDWQRVEERLRRIPMGDKDGRRFARAFLMDAQRVTVDAQGRVTIPPALLGRAGLGKEAVLLGQVDRIEIWNPEKLQVVLDDTTPQLPDLADKVLGKE
jgi:MraZ protein